MPIAPLLITRLNRRTQSMPFSDPCYHSNDVPIPLKTVRKGAALKKKRLLRAIPFSGKEGSMAVLAQRTAVHYHLTMANGPRNAGRAWAGRA
jgi:hypothetical protein